MNASMVLMTAWIAGADVVPAGCAGCAAPAPAPVAVAAPVGDCGCATADPCPCGSSGKAGLLTRIKGLLASKGGKHHKSADCGGCEPAPACDGCGGVSAAAPVVISPAPSVMPATPTQAPSVMPATPVETPKEMPKPADAAPIAPVTPKEGVKAPQSDDGLFAIPSVPATPAVVNPVSVGPATVPTLGTPANPF